MKKWLFVVLTLGAALLPATGRAQYEKGVHYLEVPFAETAPAGGRVEVREVFWYGCPHCHDLEPTIAQWLKKIPPHVKFVRTPGTLAPQWLGGAPGVYALQRLGRAAARPVFQRHPRTANFHFKLAYQFKAKRFESLPAI